MMKAGFAPSTALRYTRIRYRWGCCARREGFHVPNERRGGRGGQRSYGSQAKFRGDGVTRRADGVTRRPSNNAETLLIRQALDSDEDLLYGVNPVLQALKSNKRDFSTLFIQIRDKNYQKGDNQAAIKEIITLAGSLAIPVEEVSKNGLNVLSRERPHQGIILQSSELPTDCITRLELTRTVWIALDQVTDPHNVGAIIRTAKFLGAGGVLLCQKNCSALTPTVSKASAGCMESFDVRYIRSMPRFLRAAKDDGWFILGLGVDGDKAIVDVDRHGGVILVVGSEGYGMRSMVQACCDEVARIDGKGEGCDSLNVSVATGVALFQLLNF